MKKRLTKKRLITGIFNKTILIILSAMLFLYCVSLLIPLVWMLLTSVKSDLGYIINPIGFPREFKIQNYIDVLTKYLHVEQNGYYYGIGVMFYNSVVMSIGTSLVNVFWTVVCGYLFARYDFFGKKTIFTIGVVIMVITVVGTLPAEMRFYRTIGFYDNMYLMTFAIINPCFSGLNFLICHAAFKGISKEYTEAATIDGAGFYSIMFKIIVPMALPTATVLFVLSFIGAWNDYSRPLIWLPSYPNIPYGMYRFQMGASSGGDGANIPIVMAGFVIVMMPIIILYSFSQKIINSNFVVGGIKG